MNEPVSYEPLGGDHIRDVLAATVKLANEGNRRVVFNFNDVLFAVLPTDTYESAKERFEGVAGYKVLTAEEQSELARQSLEKLERESAEAIARADVPTEAQMRAMDAPWPKTIEELTSFIQSVVDRPHDYGTCVYAMSLSAVAAMHYAASKVGSTGFQASCADLDILRRTRHLDGPFGIVKAEDMLYPQYDIPAKVQEWLEEWKPWAAEQAAKKLAEVDHAHPSVRERWEELAAART